jgi:YesN/AraC family two-component response regulator
MLNRIVGILSLSLAAVQAEAMALAIQQVPGELKELQASDTTIQLTLFAGLALIFVVMLALLFRKYRGKRNAYKDNFNDGSHGLANSTFTPTFFSSESSPAILVADHNNDLRLFITNTLRLNYRVVSTSDGQEALDKATETVPDLIITNRYMPGLDGPLLCRKLKATESTSHIPVIITSDETDASDQEWTHYADDHLIKVFDARELLMRVHNLIAQRKQMQEQYREQIRNYPSTMSLPEKFFVQKLLNVVEEHYRDPLFGVEQLTSRLDMSRLQLYRKLKALTTYAPGEFIRQYRLEHAKQLLLKDGSTVIDVAARTGFINLPTFTKAFKEYTGKSPVEYAEVQNTSDEYLVED